MADPCESAFDNPALGRTTKRCVAFDDFELPGAPVLAMAMAAAVFLVADIGKECAQ